MFNLPIRKYLHLGNILKNLCLIINLYYQYQKIFIKNYFLSI
jgi:hypothetical protein